MPLWLVEMGGPLNACGIDSSVQVVSAATEEEAKEVALAASDASWHKVYSVVNLSEAQQNAGGSASLVKLTYIE